MAQTKKSENVPKPMQEKYQAIVEITDSFSREDLNEEYAQLIRFAVAALCRKASVPGRNRKSKYLGLRGNSRNWHGKFFI